MSTHWSKEAGSEHRPPLLQQRMRSCCWQHGIRQICCCCERCHICPGCADSPLRASAAALCCCPCGLSRRLRAWLMQLRKHAPLPVHAASAAACHACLFSCRRRRFPAPTPPARSSRRRRCYAGAPRWRLGCCCCGRRPSFDIRDIPQSRLCAVTAPCLMVSVAATSGGPNSSSGVCGTSGAPEKPPALAPPRPNLLLLRRRRP